MPFDINPREVLKHLNEMGYTDISAIQLREFIRDLKVLIKYNNRKKSYSQNQENIHPESYYYNDPRSSTDKEVTFPQEFYLVREKKNNKSKEAYRSALRQDNHERITSNVPLTQEPNHSIHRLYPTSSKADYDRHNTQFNTDSYEDLSKTPYYSNIFTYSNSSNFGDHIKQTNSHAYKNKPNYSGCSIQPDVCDVEYDDLNADREEYLSKVFNNLYCNSTASSRAKTRHSKVHPQKFHQRDLLGRDEGDFQQKSNIAHFSSNTKNENNDILTLYEVQRLKSGLSSTTADTAYKSATGTEHMKYNSKQSSKVRSMFVGSGSIQSEPPKYIQKQRFRSQTNEEVQGIMGSGDIRFEPKTNNYNENTEADGQSVRSEPTDRSEKNTRSRPKSLDCPGIKPKVSFIRPRQPLRISKSDPVTMYHQYQEEWKKIKLPGEDKRFDLRWAIREKMLAGPDIEVRSRYPTEKGSRRSLSMKSLN